MKISFLIVFLCVYAFAFAQEAKGKIDMHGGKEQNTYEKKRDFKMSSYGVSALFDVNATKKEKPTKK